MKNLALAVAGLSALAHVPAAAEQVSSPDGRITVTPDADGEGVPFYSVERDGKPVIAKSTLGFNFTDAEPLRRNLAIAQATTGSVDARWEQPWGERQFVTDRHNELAITFAERDDTPRRVTVRMRVFDDGIGFRYELPEQAGLPPEPAPRHQLVAGQCRQPGLVGGPQIHGSRKTTSPPPTATPIPRRPIRARAGIA